ncbi:acetolactate synthase-1/2/3 large subunit [Nocardioides sp. YR527]|uniref:thiamine pyrophosphate-binding protein n=1 Tax=Nocardioides sp. YR527 TaxID=1881028 RepID=UPI0008914C6E|nr:thiamine pyrophosphate-binding protein [Nocardioides sp. YR527]SDK52851.1 acetolactate synthase-1/2/3 large subunit [Nocardioides sp. YR527]
MTNLTTAPAPDVVTYADGGDLLVAVLREVGVDTVFGVISVHNLPLVEAVSRELRFVPVRHEASAVNAADGYARATGGLGCALTSTGTGAGNAAGSLVESLSSATSVLHVTGQVESAYLGSGRGFIHETKDQLGMLEAVSLDAVCVPSLEESAGILRAAVDRALGGPGRAGGPVSVEWPIDLQYLPQREVVTLVEESSAEPGPGAPAGIDELIDLVVAAERPLIWAGGGVAEAGAALTELIDAWGAGLLTSNSGRGAVPEDHLLVVGNYGATPGGGVLLAEADLLLSIGTHFRSNETRDYDLVLPAVHVQVDLDPAALGRVFPIAAGVAADARDVLPSLTAAVRRRGAVAGEWRARVTRAREDVRTTQREGLGDHAVLADALRSALPRRSVLARDVTIASSSWGNRLFEVYDPRDNVFPRGGGIGQGLGMGLGAAMGRPDEPTVVIAGDGGLAVHLGELLTLAQERPWLVLLVFNDGGYGVLRNMQEARGVDRAGVDLTTPDFAALAGALGLDYQRIGTAAEAATELERAVARRGPVLVEVDLASFGPMPRPFTPPVKVPDPTTRRSS